LMKFGRPEGDSTVVGYPMPLAVVSSAMEPMTTSIKALRLAGTIR
jgi:hypothetical protein